MGLKDSIYRATGVDKFGADANVLSDSLGYGSIQQDPRRNAMEHVYTSAQLTKDWGAILAAQFGNANEYGGTAQRVLDGDLSPKFDPAIGRVRSLCLPLWAGCAMAMGVEPS